MAWPARWFVIWVQILIETSETKPVAQNFIDRKSQNTAYFRKVAKHDLIGAAK